MNSKHLIDPEIVAMLDGFPDNNFSDENIVAVRKNMAEMMASMPSKKIQGVSVREKYIDGVGFKIRILIYTPENNLNERPALFHVHGGGYVVGSPEDFDGRNQLLCKELEAVIVSASYRLAPEHPFPDSIDDCYTALKWLFSNAVSLGVDASRIAIYGESAGGGLAASLAILVRDKNEVNIVHQFLIYPMLDDRTSLEADPNPYAGEFIWTNERNYYGWKSLLGHEPGGDDVSPYASASRISNMQGLAPVFICVGALDLFVDENIVYAQRLIRSGIPTELHVYPGGFHGFDTMQDSAISKQFYVDLIRAMKKALSAPNINR